MKALTAYGQSIFGDDFCDDVIKLASHLPELDGAVNDGEVNSYRRCKIRWITPNRDSEFIYSALDQAFRDVNRDRFGFDIDFIPEIQFTEYDESYQGNFDWHSDTVWTGSKAYNRKLSMSIQLSPSTSYVGGDLLFRGEAQMPAEEVRPRGTVIIFPSFVEHCVTPVTQGKRQSLVAWMEGPNFR